MDSIRALDEQIREHERIISKLKRARNSLNVSKLPPEVLGQVFSWNVMHEDDFGGLEEGSHNFLFVCHHWLEVASHTPDLWSFWGNTPEDWTRWYPHSGTGPLDLVLDSLGYNNGHLDAALCGELEDRAAKDAIRQVHLRAENSELLSSIISLLTAKREGTRSNGVESFVLWNWDEMTPVDVSGFFSHYRFPRLRHLRFANCTISSWDGLASRTGVLTTLDIATSYLSTSPTTSQLLSILASNPLLQTIGLDRWATPFDDGGTSSFRVVLRYLKRLKLAGDLQDVFGLLHWLDHPKNMDCLVLELDDCSVVGVSQLVGPYIRDYLRGCGSSQNGLQLTLSSNHDIILHVKRVSGTSPPLQQAGSFVAITIGLREALHREAQEGVVLDLLARAPWEEIVYLEMDGNLMTIGNVYPRFPNLRALTFDGITLSVVFPEPDVNDGALLSLRHLYLKELVVDGDDWSPLTTFLACRASSGNRLDTLEIICSPHVGPATMEVIRGMASEVKIECRGMHTSCIDHPILMRC